MSNDIDMDEVRAQLRNLGILPHVELLAVSGIRLSINLNAQDLVSLLRVFGPTLAGQHQANVLAQPMGLVNQVNQVQLSQPSHPSQPCPSYGVIQVPGPSSVNFRDPVPEAGPSPVIINLDDSDEAKGTMGMSDESSDEEKDLSLSSEGAEKRHHDDPNKGRCRVCWDRVPSAYFLPCFHAHCLVCTLEVRHSFGRCPACRVKIKSYVEYEP